MDSSKKSPHRGTSGRKQRSSASYSAMFPFGSPINSSRRSILSPGPLSPGSSGARTTVASPTGSHHVLRGRVRAQDVYGGPLMFGGNSANTGTSSLRKTSNNSGRLFNTDYTLPDQTQQNGSVFSQRRNRLLFSASPYHSAASARIMNRKDPSKASSTIATASNTPSPSSCSSTSSSAAAVGGLTADGMSSTARLILDTLDKMSTPLKDAQKLIPLQQQTPSRAEKRKLIAEKLNLSSADTSPIGSAAKRARRRPNLGSARPDISATFALKGPPVRSVAFMSPVPANAAKPRTLTPLPLRPVTKPKSPVKSSTKAIPKPAAMFTTTSTTSSKIELFSAPSQQSSLGGKIKAKVGGLSDLRAQRAKEVVPSQPTSSSSILPATTPSLNVNTLPAINFGKSLPPPMLKPSLKSVPTPLVSLPKAKTVVSTGPEFKFRLPEKVPAVTVQSVQPLNGLVFRFSSPSKVDSSAAAKVNQPLSPERMVVLPDFLTHAGSSSSKMPVMKMPSSAPKPLLKAGSVMDVLGQRGNRSKLPDVTSTGKSSSMFEGAGIKPANELRNSSVMSILGGLNKEPTWDSKFKSSSQTWQ